MEEILLFNKYFFVIVDTCLSCENIVRQSCAMVRRRQFFAQFLHPVFSASDVQHILNMHSKFALRPHHVWKYGRHPISLTAENMRGKEEEKEDSNHHRKNVMACPLLWAAIMTIRHEKYTKRAIIR